jgi:hypothetical protein
MNSLIRGCKQSLAVCLSGWPLFCPVQTAEGTQQSLSTPELNARWSVEWERTFPSQKSVETLRVDRHGNGHVAGLLGTNSFVSKIAVDGRPLWTFRIPMRSNSSFQHFTGLTLDHEGNVFVAGDARVLKLTPFGELVWMRDLPELDDFFDRGVMENVVAGCDQIVVLGERKQSFVRRYDASGRLLWTYLLPENNRPVHATLDADEQAYVLSTRFHSGGFPIGNELSRFDRDGNVVFRSSIPVSNPAAMATDALGNTVLALLQGPLGGSVLMRYDNAGIEQWRLHFETVRFGLTFSAMGIATDDTGTVTVAGSSQGYFWLAQVDVRGKVIWSRSYPLEGFGQQVSVPRSGEIYALIKSDSFGQPFAIAKFNAAGDWLWTSHPPILSARYEMGVPILAVDESDTIHVAGSYGLVQYGPAEVKFLSTESSRQVVSGQSVELRFEFTATPPLQLQWLRNGSPLDGVQKPVLQIAQVEERDQGEYRLRITTERGATLSPALHLDVLPPNAPFILEPIVAPGFNLSEEIMPGTSIAPGLLRALAQGDSPFSYGWLFNGKPIPGATNWTLAFAGLRPEDDGLYQAVVRNNIGTATSAPIRLKVTQPLKISVPVRHFKVRPGERVELVTELTGSESLFDSTSYAWWKNGEFLPNSHDMGPRFVLDPVQTRDAGQYVLVTANRAGTALSAPIVLEVESAGVDLWQQVAPLTQPGGALWISVVPDTAGQFRLLTLIPDAGYFIERRDAEGQLLGSFKINPPPGALDRYIIEKSIVSGEGSLFVAATVETNRFAPRVYSVQRISPEGTTLWNSIIYACTTRGALGVVGLALAPDGGVILAGTEDLARLDANGNILWIAKSPLVESGANFYENRALNVALDGNIFLAGQANFQGYLTQIDASGTKRWSTQLPGLVNRLRLDHSGNALAAGHLSSSPWLEYVAKIDADGDLWWLIDSETLFQEAMSITDLAMNREGDVIILAVQPSAFRSKLARISSGGEILWVVPLPETNWSGLQLEANDGVWVTSNVGTSISVLQFDRFGNRVWSHPTSFSGQSALHYFAGAELFPFGNRLVIWAKSPNEQNALQGLLAIEKRMTNSPPIVRMRLSRSTYYVSESISIEADAMDLDGTVQHVDFFAGAQWIGRGLPPRFHLLWPNVNPGEYAVTARAVDDRGSEQTSLPVRLRVISTPRFSAPLRIQQSPFSPTLDIVGEVNSFPPPQFQWKLNGQVIIGAMSATLRIPFLSAKDSGIYQLIAINDAGVAISDPLELIVPAPEMTLADKFGERALIHGASGTASGSNREATGEPGEPVHFRGASANSVWFSWIASTNGLAEFDTKGSAFDTVLAVYTNRTSEPARLASIEPVTADDDSAGFLSSRVVFRCEAGVEYMFAIAGLGDATGRIVLNWKVDDAPGPLMQIVAQPASQSVLPNENARFAVVVSPPDLPVSYQWYFRCNPLAGETNGTLLVSNVQLENLGLYFVRLRSANRLVESLPASLQISQLGNGPGKALAYDKFQDVLATTPRASLARSGPRRAKLASASVSQGVIGLQFFSTDGATLEPSEGPLCGVPGGASYWFAITALEDGLMTVTTDGSSFDTLLGVFTGDLLTRRELACNNDGGIDGKDSTVQFEAKASQSYYIRVDGVNGATGLVQLKYVLDLSSTLVQARWTGVETFRSFQMRFGTRTGRHYRIQASIDLIRWTDLSTELASTNWLDLVDTKVNRYPQRFYRVIPAP